MESTMCVILLRDLKNWDTWHIATGLHDKSGRFMEQYELPIAVFGKTIIDCYVYHSYDRPNIIWIPYSELDINIEWVYK